MLAIVNNVEAGEEAGLSKSAPEEPRGNRPADWRAPIVDYLRNPS